MKKKEIFKNIISILSTISIFILLYTCYNQRIINNQLEYDNSRYQSELAFLDSINNILLQTNAELDSANIKYKLDSIKYKNALDKIQKDYDEAVKELKNKPIDSIAAYIVLNYLGDTYKIKQINDTTFVAFQEITVRDIAERTELFKAQNKRFEALSNKIDSQDSLIKLQAKNTFILNNTIDTLLYKYNTMNIEYKNCENKILDLTNEIDKQKRLKRIGFYSSGGLLLLTLLIII